MKRWLGRAARCCFGAGVRGAAGGEEFFFADTSPSGFADGRGEDAVALLVTEASHESQGRAEAAGEMTARSGMSMSVFIVSWVGFTGAQ